MNRILRHPLMLMSSAMVRAPFMLIALIVYPLALLAIYLLVDNAGAAIGLTIALSALIYLPLWAGPVGSILIIQRQRREFRLPALKPQRAFWYWLAAINLGLPALSIALRSQDHDWAVFCVFILLCIGLGWMLLYLLPVFITPLIGFVPLAIIGGFRSLDIEWTNLKRIEAIVMVIAIMAGILIWRLRNFLTRQQLNGGPNACLLEKAVLNPSAMMNGDLFVNDPAQAFRQGPAWLMPRVRTTGNESAAQRLALFIGQPYAPGFLRRVALINAVIYGVMIGAIYALSGSGNSVSVFGWMLVSMILGIMPSFSSRLMMLFRRDTPELTELALLPGMDNAAQLKQRTLRLLCLRPALALLAFTAAVTPVLYYLQPKLWYLPLAWSSSLALLWLETAHYLQHGRSFLGGVTSNVMVYMLVIGACTGALAAALTLSGGAPFIPWILAGLVALMVVAALRLRAASQQLSTLPRGLMAASDRAST